MTENGINLKDCEHKQFWIHCSHDPKYIMICIQPYDPETIFDCCSDCYHRLLGFFLDDVTKIRVKVK